LGAPQHSTRGSCIKREKSSVPMKDALFSGI
jgi:hypothetical protein